MRWKKLLPLDPDERIHGIFRRHEVMHAATFLYAALFLVVPFFFLFRLMRLGDWGWFLLLGSLFTGIVIALRAFFFWQTNVLIVTSKRVTKMTRLGWWRREMYEVLLREVGEVKCQRVSLLGLVFRFGTVIVRPLGGEGMTADALPHPERVMRLIQDLKARLPHHAVAAAEVVHEK